MKLYSYVVARDFGFAPNPFYGMCTLATCKPNIRNCADIDDWVIGTGSSKNGKRGYLVYGMKVSSIENFNNYWDDIRYKNKKPNLTGSKKLAFGDNIYHMDKKGIWHQADSHHSNNDGTPNNNNTNNDTKVDRVLISTDFAYWGGSGPKIPKKFRSYKGCDICAIRNHKCNFPENLESEFLLWFKSLDMKGYIAPPLDWTNTE